MYLSMFGKNSISIGANLKFICSKMAVFLSFFLSQSIAVDLQHIIQLVWPQGFGQQENPLVRRLQEEGLNLGCHPGRLFNEI